MDEKDSTIGRTTKMDEKGMVVGATDRSGTSSPPHNLPPGLAHSTIPDRDLDQAYKYLESKENNVVVVDDALSLKALRRKIDWHIVPIMFCCYTMQFIDKVLLNVRIAPPSDVTISVDLHRLT